MLIKNFSDLYYYHDLLEDNLLLSADEVIVENKNRTHENQDNFKQQATRIKKPTAVENLEYTQAGNEEKKPLVLATSVSSEEKRESLKNFYIECLKNKPCPQQRAGCSFIFGAGEVINLETIVVYPVARQSDKEKSKILFDDQAGRYIKQALQKVGIDGEKMFFIPFVKTDIAFESLSPTILKIHAAITLRQLEILQPKLVLVFGTTPGRILINSTSSDIRIDSGESLHDLRNKRKVNKKNGINFVVSYDPDDIAKDSFKRNEFLSNDSVFMASLYRAIFY